MVNSWQTMDSFFNIDRGKKGEKGKENPPMGSELFQRASLSERMIETLIFHATMKTLYQFSACTIFFFFCTVRFRSSLLCIYISFFLFFFCLTLTPSESLLVSLLRCITETCNVLKHISAKRCRSGTPITIWNLPEKKRYVSRITLERRRRRQR